MASITVKLTGICAGGEHFTFTATGDMNGTVAGFRDEITQPFSEDERQAFVKTVSKLARIGRTNAEARDLLQAGVTVTV